MSANYAELGFLRVAAFSPELALANPIANAAAHRTAIAAARDEQVAVALFPELSLTGYSAEDLFFATTLHQQVIDALKALAPATHGMVVIVGAPWRARDGRLLNVAVVFANGTIVGMVPKQAHPNYGEFYERRWFTAANELDELVDNDLGRFHINAHQLFDIDGVQFAVEICEDLWAPDSPGAAHALAGASLIFNLSASNELVAKAQYREDLVRMTSAQRICGYLYASSGPLESTKDVVFGGHCLAAENGMLLGSSRRYDFGGTRLLTEFDVNKLGHDRLHNNTFMNAPRKAGYRLVNTGAERPALEALRRTYARHPFVPTDAQQRHANAEEILQIQATGLARRMKAAHTGRCVIGLSGGLDSTLALLVCIEAMRKLELPTTDIMALTLPGPGTSPATKRNAKALAAAAGVSMTEISIAKAVKQHLADLKHEDGENVVFENAQARERTQILFNYANQVHGIVVGTGDLSELALGWCTYNADQMASYNVNGSVPKTLVASLVRYYASERADTKLARVLQKVVDTPISPELLTHKPGEMVQQTESIIGPYELHDFFLFHWLRGGATPEKIFALACVAFEGEYPAQTIRQWLRLFFSRFFTQQFKRTTLPPGPKVGSVSLSPRGDWRMPDEVDSSEILRRIDALPVDNGSSS
ncbi:MAG: NAD(+) synthase [Pseudomonadales bacterium]